MTLYDLTVSQFVRVMGQMPVWFDKAQAHATHKKFDVNTLLTARLAPDQFPLARQIQSVSDQSKGICARLAGVAPPSFEDTEKTFDELRARLDKTVAFLKTLKPEQFAGAETRAISLPWAPGKALKGLDYALVAGLPNFYFHATTTYAILRHNGVEVGKSDFLGAMPYYDV